MPASPSNRILRRPEVEARFGIPTSTLYDAIRAGTFPRPIKLGSRSIGFLENEVDAWLESRIEASRAKG